MKNIWVPLSGQIAQQYKVETIANNVANANTPGFKKDDVTFKEYLTALDKGSDDIHIPNGEWRPSDFYHSHGAENAYVKVDGTYTKFDQGALNPTNNPLDIAIKGNGFFEVQTPNGIRFTRTGQFTISKDGELVTSQGFKIMSKLQASSDQGRTDDASSIELRAIKIPHGKMINIDQNGKVTVDGRDIASISIVEFKDPHALKKEGAQLFINNHADNEIRNDTKSLALQGFVEESNVNAIQEMSELINAHRHFDHIQKAINTYDSISGRAVNDIAKF